MKRATVPQNERRGTQGSFEPLCYAAPLHALHAPLLGGMSRPPGAGAGAESVGRTMKVVVLNFVCQSGFRTRCLEVSERGICWGMMTNAPSAAARGPIFVDPPPSRSRRIRSGYAYRRLVAWL